ncbi:extracellular solute-binding protein [Streptomyces sp. N2-109]|uniref:Extracellular solute-binding protein n=1 Tax=Streptomyces gossypii TaxID=2883101 RepID=A0ABT2JRV3_9ACTN|nr:extracellular solute-binding protein [Streptomyces gossypii]MCT2590080.1 extracellular solute-binding protein [Streptomyces gossypii]
MTPNSSSPSSALSRRGFLASSAFATAGIAGGIPLLTACGGSGSKNEGTTTGENLKDLLPAYVASDLVAADIPSKNGSAAGFTTAVPAGELAVSVPKKLGKGSELTIMAPIYGTSPKQGNPYWTAMDEGAGVSVKWENQEGTTYGQKLGAVLASSSIPDAVVIPGWELMGKIPSAINNKFADLGPYLTGDKVKDYPNLAAIPTAAWQRAVFGGKLRGLPMPGADTPNIAAFYRADLFKERGYEPPGTTKEFYDLCKELNAPKSRVWACGDMTWAAWNFFGVLPEKPYYWRLVDGKLVNRYETDEYLEALAWSRTLYSAGFVHPDAKSESSDIGNLFSSGKVMMYNADLSDWYGKTVVQRVDNPKFAMAAMDYFAHDGGDPTLYTNAPSNMWCFASEKADEKTVVDLLALANFTAAPYGSKEQRLRQFGVEGVHHTLADGVLSKNGTGNNQVFGTYEYLASPAAFLAYPDHPDVVEGMTGWQQRQGAHLTRPLFYGMQIQEPNRYTALNSQFEDLEKDIVRGRKKVGDMKKAVSGWKSSGGDKLRDWYKKLLDETGDSAS